MNATKNVGIRGFLVSVHQVMRKCSKRGCRCNKGLLHGPYWVARIRTQSGRRQEVHLGKQLDDTLTKFRQIAQS